MRLLHTSDWHIGRQLHGVSLIEDQAHVLDQIVEIAITESVDAVIITTTGSGLTSDISSMLSARKVDHISAQSVD